MTTLFVDTSGWTACAGAADQTHSQCVGARDAAVRGGARIVTTDFVVDETLTLLPIRLGPAAAEAWWRQVNESRRLRWERVDASRFERALDLFFRQQDKDYSFTDCTSFVVMRELRITTALATDRHFQQAGFVVVPGVGGRKRRR